MCEVLGATLFFASLLFILLGMGLVIIKVVTVACDVVGYYTIRTWRYISRTKDLK